MSPTDSPTSSPQQEDDEAMVTVIDTEPIKSLDHGNTSTPQQQLSSSPNSSRVEKIKIRTKINPEPQAAIDPNGLN
ncbi:hypothetical protein BLA29_006175, partial [Euroglyphus maynei]